MRSSHYRFLISFLIFYSIGMTTGALTGQPLKTGWNEIKLPADIKEGSPPQVPVTIVIPENSTNIYEGDILLLPGWNHSRHRWLKDTPLVQEAALRKFRIIAPEMGKSIYASRYFPETRLKWGPIPGLVWIQKVLLPAMNERGFLKKDTPSYLLGFSTGGRGVAQIGLEEGDRFAAAASLSGDYDQDRMPGDNLMKAVYGPRDLFESRWKWIDNPVSRAKDWKIPLYLAHGKKDRIVPLSQTQVFYEHIKSQHPELDLVFSSPGTAGHDYNFLSGEIRAILDFFKAHPEVE